MVKLEIASPPFYLTKWGIKMIELARHDKQKRFQFQYHRCFRVAASGLEIIALGRFLNMHFLRTTPITCSSTSVAMLRSTKHQVTVGPLETGVSERELSVLLVNN